MARIATVTGREELAPEHRPVWDRIAASRGRVAGPFGVLLRSPELADRAAELGAYIRYASGLDPRDRELTILAVARTLDCRYEWAAHAREARRVGVREEAIAAIRERRAPAGLTGGEALVVEFARQLLAAHRVEEATFAALRERLGEERLVELTATVGYYAMIASVLNAFEVTPGPDEDQLPV